MEDTVKIVLGSDKSKESVNTDNYLDLNLEETSSLLPDSELNDELDEYKQYIKEKDESNKYRLIFTINPLCTNVLFNTITEIVYHEGGEDCVFFGCQGPQGYSPIDGVENYLVYTGRDKRKTEYLTRKKLIEDTGYSHADIGPLVYHCGYDIFNNHVLRQKEFTVINKININDTGNTRNYFNTLSDFKRDIKGNTIKENMLKQVSAYSASTEAKDIMSAKTIDMHEYTYDTVKTYNESIRDNLNEDNGWFGFNNRMSMPVENYVNIALNKVMNNNKACEQIDMYPDRSLYSFIPKYNKYRNRRENNWDYCITYPYKNEYNNPLVSIIDASGQTIFNGIECFLYSFSKFDYTEDEETKTGVYGDGTITFGTYVHTSFKEGETVQIYVLFNDGTYSKADKLSTIESVGINGEDTQLFFTIKMDSMLRSWMNSTGETINQFRVAKYEEGTLCKYYFRKFRKLPNFKNTDVYTDSEITEEEIEKYSGKEYDFNSSLNRLAFGRNIYNDQTVQIVYNDDIVTTNLKDNLGRPLSKMYLTILKRNKGWDKWYKGVYTDEDIEYSHCFGKVTEGLDISYYAYDYNIHSLHNVNVETLDKEKKNIQETVGPIKSLNDDGIEYDDENIEFFGDLVEFSPAICEERTLEDVYHRFNTAQREIISDEFSGFTYQNIYQDDYDVQLNEAGESFEVKDYDYSTGKEAGEDTGNTYYVNIYPEGYYYKPHYEIPLKEYKNNVEEGYHTKVYFSTEDTKEGVKHVISTEKSDVEIQMYKDYGIPNPSKSKNYYFEEGDKIYLYKDGDDAYIEGIVSGISGSDYSVITFYTEESIVLADYILFKPNESKPSYAVDIIDGSGKYVWKEFKSSDEIEPENELYDSIFTNGAHYRHKNINFYLKRQDPTGIYGLSRQDGTCRYTVEALVEKGKSKDVSAEKYTKEESNNEKC